MKRRNLAWFGQTTRHDTLSKIVLQVTLKGEIWRGLVTPPAMTPSPRSSYRSLEGGDLAWFGHNTRHDTLSKTALHEGTLEGGDLAWFGHITRHDTLSKTVLHEGTLERGRR